MLPFAPCTRIAHVPVMQGKPKKMPRLAGELMPGWMERAGHGAHAADLELRRRWQAIVGPMFARNVRPAFSKDGVLHLSARTDAWAQETRGLDQTILKKLQEQGYPSLTGLKVRTVRWSELDEKPVRRARSFPVPPEGVLPPEVEAKAARISDPALRDAVRSFVYYHGSRDEDDPEPPVPSPKVGKRT